MSNISGFEIAVGAIFAFFVIKFVMGMMGRIKPAEARAKVNAGALLVDVRTPGEFAGGALPGAKNIPVSDLAARLSELPKGKPVIVYCASGMRSSKAKSILKGAGFEAHDLGPMQPI